MSILQMKGPTPAEEIARIRAVLRDGAGVFSSVNLQRFQGSGSRLAPSHEEFVHAVPLTIAVAKRFERQGYLDREINDWFITNKVVMMIEYGEEDPARERDVTSLTDQIREIIVASGLKAVPVEMRRRLAEVEADERYLSRLTARFRTENEAIAFRLRWT